ncbi:hypothetical protein MA785_000786 [Vibrio parahaemolyticus]|nr:hypothetical protein [Vibrio parahaemolyticus]EJR2787895.1 hypothetical protein [Vibrio parahaemolyticus]
MKENLIELRKTIEQINYDFIREFRVPVYVDEYRSGVVDQKLVVLQFYEFPELAIYMKAILDTLDDVKEEDYAVFVDFVENAYYQTEINVKPLDCYQYKGKVDYLTDGRTAIAIRHGRARVLRETKEAFFEAIEQNSMPELKKKVFIDMNYLIEHTFEGA